MPSRRRSKNSRSGSHTAIAASFRSCGGFLYLTVPSHQWLWSQADIDACHVQRYGYDRLQQVLQRAGFVVDFATFMFGPLVLPVLLLRTLPWLVGLGHWRSRSATDDHA